MWSASAGADHQRTQGNARPIDRLWATLALVATLWFSLAQPLPLLDFWWHLKAGEVIVTSGQLPRTDLFSFTAGGQPFVYQNWLAEIIYYLTYRLAGLPALITLNAVVLTVAFGFVLDLSWRASGNPRVGAACTLLAVTMAGRVVNVRPQVFSFCLFAVCYWLVWRHRLGSARTIWLLPLVMAVWVNLHGAFVLGLGLISLITLTDWVQWAVARWTTTRLESFAAAPSDRQTRTPLALLAALVLGVLATFANPEGPGVYSYVGEVLSDPISQNLVQEWQSPNITDPWDVPYFIGLLAAAVAFTYARRRPPTVHFVIVSVFAALAFSAVRNVPWFGIVLAPVLAAQIKLTQPLVLSPVEGSPVTKQAKARLMLSGAIWFLLVAITVVLSPWIRPGLLGGPLGYGLVDARTPVGAADYLKTHPVGPLFNPQHYGDYLLWQLYPNRQVFVDSRVHLYGLDVWQQYIAIMQASNWEQRLRKFDVQQIVFDVTDVQEARLLVVVRTASGWREAYRDNLSVVYERAD